MRILIPSLVVIAIFMAYYVVTYKAHASWRKPSVYVDIWEGFDPGIMIKWPPEGVIHT